MICRGQASLEVTPCVIFLLPPITSFGLYKKRTHSEYIFDIEYKGDQRELFITVTLFPVGDTATEMAMYTCFKAAAQGSLRIRCLTL
jgi:hypothetical protein